MATERMRGVGRLAALALAAGLAGCFSLSRTEPPQQHYVLGGTLLREDPGAPDASSSPLAGLAIGVRRARLAPYLEPPFLVVREGEHEIAYSEYHRWGEQPGVGINRALTVHLQALAPFRVVHAAPWAARERHDYLVRLHVEHFEGVAAEGTDSTGAVRVRASWEIIRPLDGEVVARGTTDVREAGWVEGDFAALVGLLDQGLAVVAGEVVARLEEVVAGGGGGPLAPRPGSTSRRSPGSRGPDGGSGTLRKPGTAPI
jgi:uncharacterized lipoprotein YmbA